MIGGLGEGKKEWERGGNRCAQVVHTFFSISFFPIFFLFLFFFLFLISVGPTPLFVSIISDSTTGEGMSGGQVRESPLFLSPLSSPIHLGPLPGLHKARTPPR